MISEMLGFDVDLVQFQISMFNDPNKDQMELDLQKYKISPEGVHTFSFESEETKQSKVLDIPVPTDGQNAYLFDILEEYCPLKNNKVSLYDPDQNKFVCLCNIGAEINGIVPKYLLHPKIILIRFKYRQQIGYTSQSDSSLDYSQSEFKQKKDRSRQRTIREIIEVVKRWRSIHLNSQKPGHVKQSLKQAAKEVGVSKKSLDDYYYQLRLGQYCKFDFNSNLDQKVGILRAYVKEYRPERELKDKNMRHPKNLKILDECPTIFEEKDSQKSEVPRYSQNIDVQEGDGESLQSLPNPYNSNVQENDFQVNFYKHFHFGYDDRSDPFIQMDRDFKKKALDDDVIML